MRGNGRVLAGLMLALLLSTAPADAEGSQETRGEVTVPILEECGGLIAAVLASGTWLEPSVGFTVRRSTWGARFVLAPDGPADVDIVFSRPGSWWNFQTRALGGESGRVPRGAARAEVCLSVGAPTAFTYRAGSALTVERTECIR